MYCSEGEYVLDETSSYVKNSDIAKSLPPNAAGATLSAARVQALLCRPEFDQYVCYSVRFRAKKSGRAFPCQCVRKEDLPIVKNLLKRFY